MATRVISPAKIAVSPQISISPVPDDNFPAPPNFDESFPTLASSVDALLPSSDCDRYFTASSGDDAFDDSDDGMCIMLDSDSGGDGDNESLSGLQINLKTLQAVSTMLAHYRPIIQRDEFGNPRFVAPPPPPLDNLDEEYEQTISLCQTTIDGQDEGSSSHIHTDEDSDGEINSALQELEDVIIAGEHDFMHDKMTELTDAVHKMTYYSDDMDEVAATSSF